MSANDGVFERIHHVAYTVDDIDGYRPFFEEILGMTFVDYREMPDAGYDAAVYRVGETYIEVQEPQGHPEIEAFHEEHGNGLNHVAYEVNDLDQAVETLAQHGLEPEWDEAILAPTFPGCELLDMDVEMSKGIYLQLVEELED
ncbi:VOC family protein [Halegenticoccus tardaugens]|uniref:VOC family protein n=1 Tax=Halegenticoccus tardaugens TaxID=2071624 RepID=UPI00100B55E0|nr:VOC family protein [Halegenticoccus tardaugens]